MPAPWISFSLSPSTPSFYLKIYICSLYIFNSGNALQKKMLFLRLSELSRLTTLISKNHQKLIIRKGHQAYNCYQLMHFGLQKSLLTLQSNTLAFLTLLSVIKTQSSTHSSAFLSTTFKVTTYASFAKILIPVPDYLQNKLCIANPFSLNFEGYMYRFGY